MKLIKINTSFIILALSIVLGGCQTMPYQGKARVVKVKPKKEGVIALPLNPRPEDRLVAETKMKMNCNPGTYEVLEEGEFSIGQKTKSNSRDGYNNGKARNAGSLFGLPITVTSEQSQNRRSEQVTSDIKEWRMNYKCIALKSSSNKKKKRL